MSCLNWLTGWPSQYGHRLSLLPLCDVSRSSGANWFGLWMLHVPWNCLVEAIREWTGLGSPPAVGETVIAWAFGPLFIEIG